MEETKTTAHIVKIYPNWFEEVCCRKKDFEIRKKDRDYKVGDLLFMREWSKDRYTGREVIRAIKYIYDGDGLFGLEKGYCVLGLASAIYVKD